MPRRRDRAGPRRRLASGARQDPWGRVRAGLALLAMVIGFGTVGYAQLGLTLADALYQTVITITTVGYREIGNVDGSYQVFTIVLILTGVGTALYTLGVLIESLFEGRLDHQIRRRRMQKDIDGLRGHVVLCGFGQVGRSIYRELTRAGRTVVVVDRADFGSDSEPINVVGDATSEEILLSAGLERAESLVLALDSDVDNLYISLTARSMLPNLFIVARSNRITGAPRLHQAGVDRVVNTHEIGGAKMAALVQQRSVVDFLDVVMHNEQLEVRMEEFHIKAGSRFHDTTLAECAIGPSTGATILAVRHDGAFETNPSDDYKLGAGDVLIALGTESQLRQLESRVHG